MLQLNTICDYVIHHERSVLHGQAQLPLQGLHVLRFVLHVFGEKSVVEAVVLELHLHATGIPDLVVGCVILSLPS